MMARASPELMNQTWVVELTAELSELDVLTLDVICRNEHDHGSNRVSWKFSKSAFTSSCY